MSASSEIRAPAEQTEGTRSQLLRWLKRVGESVEANEPLIELETDKVTVEVASPASGVLAEILKQEQDEIVPGELLGRIETGAARSAGAAVAGEVAGAAAANRAAAAGAARAGAPAGSRATSQASPAVQRLLAERGLSAADVQGTGPSGRITVEDVLRAPATGDGGRPEARAPAAGEKPAASVRSHLVPHSAVRRRIAEHMVQSLLHTAPHVTTVFEADLTAVLKDRARRREEFAQRGAPLTLTAYFVQAAVAAIRVVPEANSRWTDGGLEIYDDIHIGIATAVEGTGLVVPVLHDAGTRDLLEIARGLEELVGRARSGTLAPADVRGGTFTISNHGVSGSLLAAPIIINQPQSAILGVGKLEKRPVVIEEGDEQKIAVQPRCYVTLTLDHRAMDGHQANRFMQIFVGALADGSA
ncbi:MAG TPA: dihydrolipoamide acetyltransferase family protein [Steroidobacteraceae bacterium]|nr:dihydrolipoamide acetyltransferase family protein [Steroidobacteraceae bacterium]